MQHRLITFSAMLFLGLGLTNLKAQVAIPASGGNASGNGGSMSYTVGQVMYTTNTGPDGSMAQGVQQPFEISVVTGLSEAKGITLICQAYPNPAKEYVTLNVENYKVACLMYQLYDISGKLLENKKVAGNETRIDLSNLVIATYFLKVIQSNKELKTFKIIKN